MIFDLRQRPLFAAVIISLVLHLLVLFAGTLTRSAPPGGETVTPQLQVLVRAGGGAGGCTGAIPVRGRGAPQPVPRAQQQPQAARRCSRSPRLQHPSDRIGTAASGRVPRQPGEREILLMAQWLAR